MFVETKYNAKFQLHHFNIECEKERQFIVHSTEFSTGFFVFVFVYFLFSILRDWHVTTSAACFLLIYYFYYVVAKLLVLIMYKQQSIMGISEDFTSPWENTRYSWKFSFKSFNFFNFHRLVKNSASSNHNEWNFRKKRRSVLSQSIVNFSETC